MKIHKYKGFVMIRSAILLLFFCHFTVFGSGTDNLAEVFSQAFGTTCETRNRNLHIQGTPSQINTVLESLQNLRKLQEYFTPPQEKLCN